MIAVNDAVDVLRHGWQDAASTFAPASPEIAELLQARLEMVVATGALDETHLLGAIEDVESMAASAGSTSGQALARRLHRTVYEYLLALDAAPPAVAERDPEPAAELPDVEAPAEPDATAIAPAGLPVEPDAPAFEAVATEPEAAPPATAGDAGEELRTPRDEDAPGDAGATDATALQAPVLPAAVATTDGRPAPKWRYTAHADPSPDDIAVFDLDVTGSAGPPSVAAVVAEAADAAEATSPLEDPGLVDTTPGGAEPLAAAAPAASEPAGSAPDPADGFVAPRAGFHIVESTHPSNVPGDDESSPLQMPAFAADEVAARATHEFTTTGPLAPAAEESSPRPVADDHEVDPEAGWRVRGLPTKTADGRPGTRSTSEPDMEDDPFETNPRLAELRRNIDERLRRKRCDEAAALLQELAQDTGGRVVAELAMNAGDRCQSLGKSNAALNCYLAASRADPVYELPLSRLADICIDDQDTELAVSYLERIARLHRFRGEDKAALRVYRRIATIAPYREDVLTVLMNAQSTGRFEA